MENIISQLIEIVFEDLVFFLQYCLHRVPRGGLFCKLFFVVGKRVGYLSYMFFKQISKFFEWDIQSIDFLFFTFTIVLKVLLILDQK